MSYIIEYSRLAGFLQRIRSHKANTSSGRFYIPYNETNGNRSHISVSYTLPYAIETFKDKDEHGIYMRAGRFLTASFECDDKFYIAAKFYMESTSATEDFVRAVGNEYAAFQLHLYGDTTVEEVEEILIMVILTSDQNSYDKPI